MKYNAAIIGAGQIAWKIDSDPLRQEIWSHYSAYQANKRINDISVCDIDVFRLEEFPYTCSTYDCHSNLLEYTQPDIVSICTPTQTHYPIIMDLLEYPIKAIFCEKPLAYTSTECREIIRSCKEKNVVLAVNYMRRWENLYLAIKDLIKSKKLLDIKSIICYTNTALYMNASHMIDLILMLCGDIQSVYGVLDTTYIREVHGMKDPGGIFHFTTDLNVEGLLYAYGDDKSKHQFELDLQFQNGRLKVLNDGLETILLTYGDSNCRTGMQELNTKIPLDFEKNERLVDAIDNILNVVEGKDSSVNCSGLDAIKSIHVIEACYRSSERGEISYVIST